MPIALAVAEAGRVTAAVVYLPALTGLHRLRTTHRPRVYAVSLTASKRPGIHGRALLSIGRGACGGARWAASAGARSFRASLAYRLCLVAEGRYDGC